MPKNRVLPDSWDYSDIDYINEMFPDIQRDFRYTPVYDHPFMYFNFTFYGRTVAVRKVKRGYEVVTRCWIAQKDPIIDNRSKKAEWHVYYYSTSLTGAIRKFRRICKELISIDLFDVDWYLPYQPTLFGDKNGL